MNDPAEAVLKEFAGHYHNEMHDIDDEFHRELQARAHGSALRLAALRIPGVVEVLESLKSKDNPLHQQLEQRTHLDWTEDDDIWSVFCELVSLVVREIRSLAS